MANPDNQSMENIITVDGPSGSGKGTISLLLSQKLGWHLLDSGAIYRVVGQAVLINGVSLDDHGAVAETAENMNISFRINSETNEIDPYLDNENLSKKIRTDEAGQLASHVARIPAVRAALLTKQRSFASEPGLIADGRDMGTVVFPAAKVKIFLTASAECRAKRRYEQLKNKGVSANIRALLDSIKLRDERDKNRAIAPLVPAQDALVIDSSDMSIEAVLDQILDYSSNRLKL